MEEERKFRESLVRSPEEVLNRTKKGSFRSGESGPNSQEDFPESGMNQSESRTGKLITQPINLNSRIHIYRESSL